jgi:hypothetical protein
MINSAKEAPSWFKLGVMQCILSGDGYVINQEQLWELAESLLDTCPDCTNREPCPSCYNIGFLP